MAHMIDMSNGRANMAYVGATPWHGLGNALVAGLTIEQWQIAAGMEYAVERALVQYQNGALHSFPGKQVLYRSDTGAPLGIVSDGYKIVQPGAVLEFFRDLCEEQGMELETAGVLKGGALYWALAKTGHSLDLAGDKTNGYVLMSTSADGSKATDTRFTSIRVVCNNTLSVALSGSKMSVKTNHRTAFDAKATKQKLGLVSYDDAWTKFRTDMEALADKTVTANQATEFFSELLRPAGERAAPRANIQAQDFASLLAVPFGGGVPSAISTDKAPIERAIRGLAELEQSYYRAPGATPGNAYGLVQGVTHFIDHTRGASGDKRLTSAWFGQGDALKTKALDAALAL